MIPDIEALQHQALENVRHFKPEYDPVGVKDSGQTQDDAKQSDSDESTQADGDFDVITGDESD